MNFIVNRGLINDLEITQVTFLMRIMDCQVAGPGLEFSQPKNGKPVRTCTSLRAPWVTGQGVAHQVSTGPS